MKLCRHRDRAEIKKPLKMTVSVTVPYSQCDCWSTTCTRIICFCFGLEKGGGVTWWPLSLFAYEDCAFALPFATLTRQSLGPMFLHQILQTDGNEVLTYLRLLGVYDGIWMIFMYFHGTGDRLCHGRSTCLGGEYPCPLDFRTTWRFVYLDNLIFPTNPTTNSFPIGDFHRISHCIWVIEINYTVFRRFI